MLETCFSERKYDNLEGRKFIKYIYVSAVRVGGKEIGQTVTYKSFEPANNGIM